MGRRRSGLLRYGLDEPISDVDRLKTAGFELPPLALVALPAVDERKHYEVIFDGWRELPAGTTESMMSSCA